MQQLVSIREASELASKLLNKEVSFSNISYLIQYGKVRKFNGNGSTLIDIDDLKKYYASFRGIRELTWKKKLGNDLNWALSFDHLREKDTTKHVHRLHPYKGKFIPQLVEYFIDKHIDDFKTQVYFKKGDIILDPFAGSGTTLVQANELNMNSIGIDISRFNVLISEVKLLNYDLDLLRNEIQKMISLITSFETDSATKKFEEVLNYELAKFNNTFFPGHTFRYKLNNQKINESEFSREKDKEFSKIYKKLIEQYDIKLKQDSSTTFLDKWYIDKVKKEIDYVFSLVRKIENKKIKKLLAVILSRTIRSCRATTHSDLATLVEPQLTTYYCYKHKKICKPIFSIKNMFSKYALDTIERLQVFNRLKSNAYALPITADSRRVNLEQEIKKRSEEFFKIFKKQRIKGIFSSPPYVGQIDYHEQHAYAYDLFGFGRKDELEIGPLYKGQGIEARKSYVDGISAVLINVKKYLAENYDVFLVANDKYNLYSEIAKRAGMKVVNMFKRPVLNRTERDKSPYSEIIFHLKDK